VLSDAKNHLESRMLGNLHVRFGVGVGMQSPGLHHKGFHETLQAAGVRGLKLPKMSPNLSPYAERFVLAIKSECLDKMILFGEKHLRYVIENYISHYLRERPHRVLGRRIIEPETPMPTEGPVLCRERLGGLLKTYYRQAA